MIRYLTESDVASLLTMHDALAVLETAIADLGKGRGMNQPRQVVDIGSVRLSTLPAGIVSPKVVGFKTYTVGLNDRLRFWVILFGEDGAMRSIMEAEHLSMVRTGAAVGIATKYLAREDSTTVGILGTGYNAPAQLEAVCAVRPVKRVLAYSRTRDNLTEFCRGMTKRLGIPVEPAAGVQQAVEKADIIVTITSSQHPVLKGEWLPKGVHVNLAGAMKASRREIDTAAVQAADFLVVDDARQSREEAGELIVAAQEGKFDWASVKELSAIVASGSNQRPSPDAITMFKCHGTGLWDVAVAARVYELAAQRKIGLDIPADQPGTSLYKGRADPAALTGRFHGKQGVTEPA